MRWGRKKEMLGILDCSIFTSNQCEHQMERMILHRNKDYVGFVGAVTDGDAMCF